jgi:ring-1,2-phenylacetyl-CoA epoxidase subunit PaaC
MSDTMTETRIDKAAELPDDARAALRALILSLADSKRVQGLRFSDRMLGAPTLEAGIAASSMAQDEWGHARLTYALLGEFGDDPKGLEHSRAAAEYQSHPALDAEFGSWSDFIACMLLVDTALATQYGALVGSRYTPVQNRVQKMLDEERFHFQYAAGWTRKIAAVAELKDELAASMTKYLPAALQWLGDDSAPGLRRLVEEGLVTGDASALRAKFLAKVGPVLADAGLAEGLGLSRDGDAWTYGGSLSWDGWDETTRRSGGALDETVAARARGDKNRALLLD